MARERGEAVDVGKFKRKGTIGKEERATILLAAEEGKSSDAIALETNREVSTVEKTIRDGLKAKAAGLNDEPADVRELAEKASIRHKLRKSEAWKRLRDSFTPTELRSFDEQYVRIMGQFGEDVFPTEESQIFDYIKADLLQDRNLQSQKVALEEALRLEGEIESRLAVFGGDIDSIDEETRQWVNDREKMLAGYRNAAMGSNSEYGKLQAVKDGLMKELKATRNQRIREVEQSRTTDFLGVIRGLRKKEVAIREDRQRELFQRAGEKAYADLGRLHVYQDGVADRCILSADTVDLPERTDEVD